MNSPRNRPSSTRCRACGFGLEPGDRYCSRCGQLCFEGDTSLSLQPVATERRASANPWTLPSETTLWRGGYAWKSAVPTMLTALLLTLFFIVVGRPRQPGSVQNGWVLAIAAVWIVVLLLLIYRKLVDHYVLTTNRLVHRHGILWRKTHRIELVDIDDLALEQTLFDRLLGTGRIRVFSSDVTTPRLSMHGIDRAHQVLEMLDGARVRERRRFGLHVESI